MKFTLSWLKKHLDTDATLTEITDRLTAIGLELEEVTDPAAKLAPFKVAKVKSATQHPNADKLRVCIVETADHGDVQVVCGAPNARTGMTAVFAPVGSYVPGTDIVLKAGELRGEASNGMLVSERELEISEDHDGIIDLPDDVPLGLPFAEYAGLNDPVIEIGLTPNRGDCAGVRGIARDLAASGMGTLKPLKVGVSTTSGAPSATVEIQTDSEELCPVFFSRTISGVKNGPSPVWLKRWLEAVGQRSITSLVDITNLMTLGYGTPMHVFDVAKIDGAKLTVRNARAGDEMLALNGKDYAFTPEMVVIADDSGVASLGGIIGGERTGCTEETTEVLLEAALWLPSNVARTGRKLDVHTDARFRFERGTDIEAVLENINVATQYILDFCGGEASDIAVAGTPQKREQTERFRFSKIATRGGADVDPATATDILARLGFEKLSGDDVEAVFLVPGWRPDIQGEDDLVEEVVRIVGYDSIPAVSLPRDAAVSALAFTPAANARRRARRALAASGLQEAVTWSFLPQEQAALFGETKDELYLANAMSRDLSYMRPSLLPNLITAAGRNADRGYADVGLFEVGTIFNGVGAKEQPATAAAIRAGKSGARDWNDAPQPVSLFDAKADAIAALEAAGAPVANLQVRRAAPGHFHPGRSGVLALGKAVLAHFGEIHPRVLKAIDVKGPVVGMELFFDAIPPSRKKSGAAKPLLQLSAFQSVDRDFAFLVDETVMAESLLKAAKGADKKLISGVSLFDVYAGKGIPEGKKSLAIAVTLQPVAASLTEEDIEAVCDKVVASVIKATGGELRG